MDDLAAEEPQQTERTTTNVQHIPKCLLDIFFV